MERPNDVLTLRGAFRLAMYDLNGNIVKEQIVNNTVVTAGRAWVMKQLISAQHATAQNVSHMEIGSGTVAPTTGDIALGGAVTRKALDTIDSTNLTSSTPNWSAQATFATNEGNTTLAEVGLFNSNSGGTMLCRATFTSFVKATSNTFGVSYVISD